MMITDNPFIKRAVIAGLGLFLLYSSPAGSQEIHQSDQHAFRLVEVTSGLDYPWGLDFLPDGTMLVTEKTEAQLRLIKANGQLDPRPIAGLPKNIRTGGQGGLLDVTVHPDFSRNQWIYLSYSGSGRGGAGTEVVRARLTENRLQDVKVIFAVDPKTGGRAHYGSRLVFADDGTLFITIGDRYNYRDEAQNPENHLGSVIRLKDDGSIPADNPFVNKAGHKPEIYSYGHRNPQGLALRSDKVMWMHEHGPRGGDEVNILNKPGANYGWPAITYGINYIGTIISDKTHMEGMEQPVIHWTPSIAPSGMAFYSGDRFPNWKDDIFVGALAGAHLRRLELDGDQVVAQEVLLEDYARIRDVVNGPDGYLYFIIDDDNGKILRLEPIL